MQVKQLKFKAVEQTTPVAGGLIQQYEYSLGPVTAGWITQIDVEISLSALTVKLTMYQEDVATAQAKAHSDMLTLHAERWLADGTDHRNQGVGWDNAHHMTPTEESWLQHYKANSEEHERLMSLRSTTSVHMYRLEDIRGRIEALQ